MPIDEYSISLLQLRDCLVQATPSEMQGFLKAWRKKCNIARTCLECGRRLPSPRSFSVCCNQFYLKPKQDDIEPIGVPTPGYYFMLPQLEQMIQSAGIPNNQDFVVLTAPIFWQLHSTLIYDKGMRFVTRQPMTCRTQSVQPPSKAPVFYKQLQEAPLNYGSIESRSCGKATLIRQLAFGKRCRYSMRGMIVPDASLRPNEIRMPDYIVGKFNLKSKWIVLNRMPSLQPENVVGLRVPDDGWPHDCFGIPLEILNSINGDFDGDEANIYLVPSLLAQAECATILNPEWVMRSFVMGTKLSPCQDMLVAYYLFYDEIDFLPCKFRDLKKTLQVICEVYGDSKCFEAYDQMRLFYLDRLQNRTCFALTLKEMDVIEETLEKGGDIMDIGCCLIVQILAGAKGNRENVVQMFGRIGMQSGVYVESSFRKGLKGIEAAAHGQTSLYALFTASNIWKPGYGYQKIMFNVHNLVVNYAGNIVDGSDKRIIFRNALDGYHHEDVMSKETFMYLLEHVLKKSSK